MKILLIGCGLTGKAIVSNLLGFSFIDQIALYSRTIKSSNALKDQLNSTKINVIENLDSIINFQYIIVTLSGMSDGVREESMFKCKTTYEVRQDELKYNLGALAGLIKPLKKIRRDAKVIVVTNPVDEITNFLRIILKNENVFGFGLDLDSKRYSNLLGREILCIGTHGKAVPLINSNLESDYDNLFKKVDSELMSYIRRNGIPHNAAGEAFAKFFSKFISKKKQILHVSYYLKKYFQGVNNISISLPCEVNKGKILGIADFKVNSIEKKRFQKLVKQLKQSVNHILMTHKKLISYK